MAGLASGPIPQASAAPTVNTFQIPIVANCSTFFLPCSFTPVVITGEAPGTVTFPALYPPEPGQPTVKGSYFVHWRNLGTGTSGTLVVQVSEAVSVYTGPGLATASMTSGFDFIAGTGVFIVP
ncbi:hypothetical protein LCL87_20350 [Rhodococcus hoagii]|nr:hypothetical protein [Prescottella equi]